MGGTMRVADRTQSMRALQRANEVRLARVALKRRIADGTTSAADAVLSRSSETDSMAIIELLMSQRRWGAARCRGLLREVALSEAKTVGSMTDRQRKLLAGMLVERSMVPAI